MKTRDSFARYIAIDTALERGVMPGKKFLNTLKKTNVVYRVEDF